MANLALLVLCFALGALARRAQVLPPESHRPLTAWVLWVSLPALVFRSIQGAALDARLLLSSAALWLVFLGPAAVALVAWRRGAAAGPTGAVALCAGLGNTAFVGLPLMEAIGGPGVLGAAAVVDQLGSFVALFVFAMPFASALGGDRVSVVASLRRFVSSPATVALALALAFNGRELPAPVTLVVARLADMLSPLALAVVGWQLDLSALRGQGRLVALGLAWKLALAPALVAGGFLLVHGALGPVERVVVAQAAMAPMVTAGVVATEHRLAPGLASALIAVGVPLSLVTVPLWWWLTG